MIDQHQGSHRFDHRDGARQHARVMASARFYRGVLELNIDRVLLLHNGRDGLEGYAEINGLAVGDPSLDPARPIGRGEHFSALGPKRIVMLYSRDPYSPESTANA